MDISPRLLEIVGRVKLACVLSHIASQPSPARQEGSYPTEAGKVNKRAPGRSNHRCVAPEQLWCTLTTSPTSKFLESKQFVRLPQPLSVAKLSSATWSSRHLYAESCVFLYPKFDSIGYVPARLKKKPTEFSPDYLDL